MINLMIVLRVVLVCKIHTAGLEWEYIQISCTCEYEKRNSTGINVLHRAYPSELLSESSSESSCTSVSVMDSEVICYVSLVPVLQSDSCELLRVRSRSLMHSGSSLDELKSSVCSSG